MITADDLKRVLAEWDAGSLSRAELDGAVHAMVLDGFIREVETGGTFETFGSCCCRSHPPARKFRCEVTVMPHGISAKRIT